MSIHAGPSGPPLGRSLIGPDRTIENNKFGQTVAQEGITATFDNVDPTTLNQRVVQYRNQKKRDFILVRNMGSTTLNAKEIVKWATDEFGKRVSGVAGAGEEIAGVVDEALWSSGCKQYDMCWICVKGETLVKKASANTGAQGTFAPTGASGAIGTVASTIADDGSHVGRLLATGVNGETDVLIHVEVQTA